jgi:hypothetical protein
VFAAEFETQACKYFLFITAYAAQEREKRGKCCYPLVFQCLQPLQYRVGFDALPKIDSKLIEGF